MAMSVWYRLSIALSVLLLTACASGPTNYHALADDQIPKQNKNGTIFLHIAHADLACVCDFRENSLALLRLNTGKEDVIVIDALDDGGVTSSSYLAALPPGGYTIFSFGKHSAYDRTDLTLKDPIGTFTVQAGAFVNLGTLIVDKDRVMRSATEVPPPKLWQTRLPNLYKELTNGKPVQWDGRNTNTLSWEQLANPFAQSTRDFIELSNNQLASPGPLGMVRIRNTEGVWRDISLHNTSEILSYTRNNDSVEFAALEYQQLYLRKPGASTWMMVAAPEDQGTVRYARFAKSGLLYLLMTESGGGVKIYSTVINEVQWRLVADIVPSSNLLSMSPGEAPKMNIAAGSDDAIFITQTKSYSLGNRLIRFDYASNTAQPLTPPFTIGSNMEISHSNGIVTAHDKEYNDLHLYKSLDDGVSWQTITYEARKASSEPEMLLTSEVKYIDQNNGFAVFSDRFLMRTEDGGHHWLTAAAPQKHAKIIHLMNGGLPNELLVRSEGRYMVSRDQGQSWQVDR